MLAVPTQKGECPNQTEDLILGPRNTSRSFDQPDQNLRIALGRQPDPGRLGVNNAVVDQNGLTVISRDKGMIVCGKCRLGEGTEALG